MTAMKGQREAVDQPSFQAFDTMCDALSRSGLHHLMDRYTMEFQARSLVPRIEELTYGLEKDSVLNVRAVFSSSNVITVIAFPPNPSGGFYIDYQCRQCTSTYGKTACLHSCAMLLAMRALGAGESLHLKPRYAPAAPVRLSASIAQWLHDLDEGERVESAARKTPSIPTEAGLKFLIAVDGQGTVTARSVFMTDVEPLAKLRPIDFASQTTVRERAIAARLTDQERGWLMQMRACQPVGGKAVVTLSGTLDQQFLRMLIEHKRAVYGGVADHAVPPVIRFGDARTITPHWELTNALTCRLDSGLNLGHMERLLTLPDAWVFDERAAAIYPISGVSTAQILQLRKAPEIPREQIALFTAALERHAGVPIAPPEAIPDPVEEIVVPRALVVLSAPPKSSQQYQVGQPWERREQTPIAAELYYRYGKGRVSSDDTQSTHVVSRRGGEVVSNPRNKEAEATFAKLVQGLGLKREQINYNGTIRRQKWVAPAAIGREAIALMQALSAKGVQVELSPEIGVHCILDDGADTYGGVEEGAGGRYVVDAGIVVDGRKLSLSDLACAAMSDPEFSLTPDPEHDAERRVLVPCDATTLVSLPHARVREIIGPFFDLLVAIQNGQAGAHRDKQGRLTISRAVLIAQAFSERTGPFMAGWSGMQAIRAAVDRLREKGVEDVPKTPIGFQGTLFDHQQTGVKWLNVLHELGLGGILADDMGLGKSVQLLAHIGMRRARQREAPVLIVAPKPVIGSWKEKFHFTPELRMLVLTGADRAGRFDQIPEADIVFANYNTLRIDVETLVQHRYSLIVFDEAQNLKSHNTVSHVVAARLQADQVVMVSGRPIENHLAELHSQVSLALPGLLGDAREFTRVYRTPIEKRADSEAKQRLRERIAPFILHRTKDEVADSLPPKSVVLKTVSMTPKQRQLYNAIMLTMNQRVWDAVAEKGIASSGIVILDALRKLQQICCHPALMKDEAGEGCQESAKFDYLLEQIEELVEEGRRMLVFSQHVEYLKLIQAALVARGITPLIFTGKTRDQDSVREAFQTGQHPVMLVSLKAGGSGMDFTAADTVLFASPWWNPAAEDQAMDRVHRIGQTKPVFVYKYIVENSIEGSIIQMQEKKAELARSILDDEAGATPPLFEIADIVDLFGERGAASINTDDTIEGEWSEVVPATAPALPSPHRVQATAPVMEAPSDAGDRARVVDWVRGALFEADLSVAEMNRRLGLRNKWLSNRISGMSLLPPSILVRLATQLERPVPPDILSAACAAWGPPDPDLHGALTANQRRVSDR